MRARGRAPRSGARRAKAAPHNGLRVVACDGCRIREGEDVDSDEPPHCDPP